MRLAVPLVNVACLTNKAGAQDDFFPSLTDIHFALQVREVPRWVHARHQARSRTYVYRILHPLQPHNIGAFERGRAWACSALLNVDAMAAASQMLQGRHDFSTFRALGAV
jgi:tRNA U38,U39,U40 pseudouridine synthase TruA